MVAYVVSGWSGGDAGAAGRRSGLRRRGNARASLNSMKAGALHLQSRPAAARARWFVLAGAAAGESGGAAVPGLLPDVAACQPRAAQAAASAPIQGSPEVHLLAQTQAMEYLMRDSSAVSS